MKYDSLFIIKEILNADITRLSNILEEIELQEKSLRKDRNNILDIIRNRKDINPEKLRLIEQIINNNEINIDFNKELYAKTLGLYYMLGTDEEKSKVDELLSPIIEAIDQKISIRKKNYPMWESDLKIDTSLYEALNNLIIFEDNSYLQAIGSNLFENILNYILKIPVEIISDDEKLNAIYALNIANLEALQSKDEIAIKDDNNVIEKPFSKYKFKKENASDLEEIIDIVNIYNNINNSLSDVDKNQIMTISQQFDLNSNSPVLLNQIKEFISNIGADFSLEYYVKYSFLKRINDWYELYNNALNEEDYLAYFEEIEETLDNYHDYLQSSMMIEKSKNNPILNNLLFLQKNNGNLIGLDWMHKDRHEYKDKDFVDFDDGLDFIKTHNRGDLVEYTVKVKKAGIPGINENKFRRLRINDIRIIFVDMIHFINDEYKEYFDNILPCMLVITFGKKLGELDIYESVSGLAITNLLKEFRNNINNILEKITKTDESKEIKIAKVKEFMENTISNNNNYFYETFENDPIYGKFVSKEDEGGLTNAR